MHTIHLLKSEDYTFTIGEDQALLEEVFPGFSDRDRIGIVVNSPCGAIGVSSLLMASITRYYDVHRMKLGNDYGKLRIYPEYFIFHIGKKHGDFRNLEIWPPHKEIIVENDPEQILEQINDRGITRLLVEDIPPASSVFLRETISSAEQRIVSCIAYSSTGRVQKADLTGKSNERTEEFVLAALDDSKRLEYLSEDEYQELLKGRIDLKSNGSVIETYRRIDLSTAIRMLTKNVKVSDTTNKFLMESNPNARQEIM